MIRIIIEKVPYGDERKKYVMAVGKIWNDLTSPTAERGNYQFELSTVNKNGIWRTGESIGDLKKLDHMLFKFSPGMRKEYREIVIEYIES